MKISKVIEILQKAKEEHGDIDCVLCDNRYEGYVGCQTLFPDVTSCHTIIHELPYSSERKLVII